LGVPIVAAALRHGHVGSTYVAQVKIGGNAW
jgi:hypothetical protein